MNYTAHGSERAATITDAEPNARFHSMDALRAFALLLGVVFHAAESFCPGRESWAIIDSQAHWGFDLFQHVCHSFRMEIFFLIAGFFAHLVYHRRGAKRFVQNRIHRIAVPFVLGWVVLYPAFTAIWLWGASKSGRLEALGIPPEVQQLPVWKLTLGALSTPQFYQENFNLLHLWFLHQLMIIYVLVLAGRHLLCRFSALFKAISRITDLLVEKLVKSHWKLLWLALCTMPMLLGMRGWGVDTPNDSIFPHIPTTLLYGFFFLLGWQLHRQHHLLRVISMNTALPLVVGVLMIWPTKNFRQVIEILDLDNVASLFHRPFHSLLYGLMMWGFVFGISGLFIRFANRPSPTWRYVADSSYWVFMVHHLVVVTLQILVAYLSWGSGLKFLLINIVSFPLLFLSYHYCVRFTWIGQLLNGRRHSRSASPRPGVHDFANASDASELKLSAKNLSQS